MLTEKEKEEIGRLEKLLSSENLAHIITSSLFIDVQS